jgi:hypothetical protein
MPRMTADIGDPLYFFGRTTTDASLTGGFEYLDGGGLGGVRMLVDSDPATPVPNPQRSSSSALGWQDSAGSLGGGTGRTDHWISHTFPRALVFPGARGVCTAPPSLRLCEKKPPATRSTRDATAASRSASCVRKNGGRILGTPRHARTQDPPWTHTSTRDRSTTGAGGHTE